MRVSDPPWADCVDCHPFEKCQNILWSLWNRGGLHFTTFDCVYVVEILVETPANGFYDCQMSTWNKQEWIVESSYWTAKADSNSKTQIRVQPNTQLVLMKTGVRGVDVGRFNQTLAPFHTACSRWGCFEMTAQLLKKKVRTRNTGNGGSHRAESMSLKDTHADTRQRQDCVVLHVKPLLLPERVMLSKITHCALQCLVQCKNAKPADLLYGSIANLCVKGATEITRERRFFWKGSIWKVAFLLTLSLDYFPLVDLGSK